MNKTQAKKVTKYIIDVLWYLDGKGIIFTDDKLVKEALANSESAKYFSLERIIKGEK